MKGVNKVILIGNVGRDPDYNKLEGDVSIAKFTVATSERYRDRNSGELKDQTEWHNVIAWRHLADICQKYIHKGSPIYVEGKLRTSSWTDKDNNKRFRTEIIAENITLLDKKQEPHHHQEIAPEDNAPFSASDEPAGDLPF